MKRKKILSVVGARPNFVKIAPIVKLLRNDKNVSSLLVHTGQHYDKEMSKAFFQDLRLPEPNIYLGVGSHAHGAQTAKVMLGLEPIFIREKPDLVIVVGDVNSTLAASLVAAKLGIPLAHVEAGLRSFDMSMPEEINRIATDSLAEYLFTPSRDADINLKNEGIAGEKIHFVGNVMIDTLFAFRPIIQKSRVLPEFGLKKGDFAVVTLHRPSNVDTPSDLGKIFDSLSRIQRKIKVIFPMHPRTRFFVGKFEMQQRIKRMKNLACIKPVGYIDFLSLLCNAAFVITDSGGIQEETTVLRVPCITVRKNTERPVTVKEGTNVIAGTDPERIVEEGFNILNGKYKTGGIPELWDGKASQRIARILLN